MKEAPLSRINLTLSVIWFLFLFLTYFVDVSEAGGEITISIFRIISPLISRIVKSFGNTPYFFKISILTIIPVFMGVSKTAIDSSSKKLDKYIYSTAIALRTIFEFITQRDYRYHLRYLPLYIIRGMAQIFIWFISKVFVLYAVFLRFYNEFQGRYLSFGQEEFVGICQDIPYLTEKIGAVINEYGENITVSETASSWRKAPGLQKKLILLFIYIFFGEFGYLETGKICIIFRKYSVLIGGDRTSVSRIFMEIRKLVMFNLIMCKSEHTTHLEKQLNKSYYMQIVGGKTVDPSYFVREIVLIAENRFTTTGDMEILMKKLDALLTK